MSQEKRSYVAVIDKDKTSDYGVMFPDFPGCISAGKSLEEAREMAHEALQFHIDSMINDEEEIPDPSTLDKIKARHKRAKAFLFITAKVPTKAARINITIDEKLLRKFDKYLENHNETRSSFFAEAIREVVTK